jgi:ATP-dependent Clp protease ATP-binding subunit ClpB
VFNVLLQILDDGRLTDGKGRTVDFKNTVVIMTSNIGSHAISEADGDLDADAPQLRDALRATFRPEFLNRVDDIIVFRRLTQDLIKNIVAIQVRQLDKLLAQRDLSLDIGEGALEELAKEGYDPVYGARPLKRVIQKKIQDRLALMLLDGEVVPGDRLRLDFDGDADSEFAIRKAAPAGVGD